MAKKKFEFDVAVSFAGENRSIVDIFVGILKQNGIRVFYDSDVESELWGKDLYEHLDEVYKNKARYCVMFISEQYSRKLWTNHERRSAFERAFNENSEYILPIRIDDTVIPGIRGTIGYLDLRNKTIEEIAALAIKKVKSAETRPAPSKSKVKTVPELSVDSSNEWILLDQGFYQSHSVEQPDDNHFIVTIASQDATTDAQVESVKNHRNDGKNTIAFAFANDAFTVRCESLTSHYENNLRKWRIKLVKEDSANRGSLVDLSIHEEGKRYTAEEILHLRAERILLNRLSIPTQNTRQRSGVLGISFLDMNIEGTGSIKVKKSPIVELANTTANFGVQFLYFARLVAIYYLKATGVTERIDRLTIGPVSAKKLHVIFRGVRRSRYTNGNPTIIEIEGDCELS